MNFNEIAKMRQSTRAYDASRPVEKEKIEACLATARLAPSACNSQPWMMTVCTGETARKLAPLTGRGAGFYCYQRRKVQSVGGGRGAFETERLQID